MKRPNADHVVLKGQDFVCLHCGGTMKAVLPMEVREPAAAGDVFLNLHSGCTAPKEDLLEFPSWRKLTEAGWVTGADLKREGWSGKLIRQRLGQPDARAKAIYGTTGTLTLYAIERVENALLSPELRQAVEGNLAALTVDVPQRPRAEDGE